MTLENGTMGNPRGVQGFQQGGAGGWSSSIQPDEIPEEIIDFNLGIALGEADGQKVTIQKFAGLEGTAAERDANRQRTAELVQKGIRARATPLASSWGHRSSGKYEDRLK